MLYVGIDLHKKTITLCVVNQQREVIRRRRLLCVEPANIRAFFSELGPFVAVVEATASYEWLWQLLEPLAERLVLAHPKKLRIIAESTRKSDELDAQVLAEFLALGMIPEAYRPTLRQRQHRVLVRQRYYVRRQAASVKNKIRHVLSNYNCDRPDLFSSEGLEYMAELRLPAEDRFVLDQLLAEWRHHEAQLQALDKHLREFGRKAPVKEAEARAVLESIPYVGPVTVDIVISEMGSVDRFRTRASKRVAAFAGLAPGHRGSSDKKKELGITKEGSRLLRWALVETAWRMVGKVQRWQTIYAALQKRRGRKKAIVAVARRLLGVMVAMLHSGQRYRYAA